MTTATTTTETLKMPALDIMQMIDACDRFAAVGTQAIGNSAGYLNSLEFDDHVGALVARVKWSSKPDPSALHELVTRLAHGEVQPLKPRLTLPPTPPRQRIAASKPTSDCGCGGTTKASCACESRSLESTATDGDVCEWVTLPIVTTEIERAQALNNFKAFSECIGECSADCADIIPVVNTKGGPAVGWVRAMRTAGDDLQVSVRWTSNQRPIVGVRATDRTDPSTARPTGLHIMEVLAASGPTLRRRPLHQQHQATNRTDRTTMQTNTNTTTPKMPAPGTVKDVRSARAHLSNVHPLWGSMSNDEQQTAAIALRDLCTNKDVAVQLSRAPGHTVLACLFPGTNKIERLRAYLTATEGARFTKLTYEDQHARALELRKTANVVDEA